MCASFVCTPVSALSGLSLTVELGGHLGAPCRTFENQITFHSHRSHLTSPAGREGVRRLTVTPWGLHRARPVCHALWSRCRREQGRPRPHSSLAEESRHPSFIRSESTEKEAGPFQEYSPSACELSEVFGAVHVLSFDGLLPATNYRGPDILLTLSLQDTF